MWPLQKAKSYLPTRPESVCGGGPGKRSDSSHRVSAQSSTAKSARGMLVSISVTFGRNLFVLALGRVSRGYS